MNTVIVLGMGPSGLFLVRQLSRITDRIYGVGRKEDVGMYSKYLPKSHRYFASSAEELASALEQIAGQAGEKPKLYLASDQYLTLMLESDLPWAQYADLQGSPLETLGKINNKTEAMALCAQIGLHLPKTWGMEAYKDLDENAFPVLVKPNEKVLYSHDPVGKARLCQNGTQLCQLARALTDGQFPLEGYHIQTYIPGKNDCQFSCGGVYRDGAPLAQIVVQQCKQHPQGISALAVTADQEEGLKEITAGFARKLSFSGFLELEYKRSRETGDLYLLDINPRPWGWVSALGAAYPDFYRTLLGEAPEEAERPVLWYSPLRRLLAVRSKQNTPMPKAAKKYARARDIATRDDPKPGVMIYVMAIQKIFRKHTRR